MRLSTFTLLLFSTLIGSPYAWGQVRIGPRGPIRADEERQPNQPRIRKLTITPAAEPNPPLKHSLYPRANELQPGNSATLWYRALLLLESDPEIGRLYDLLRDTNSVPSGDVLQQARDFIAQYEYVIQTIEQAAYREKVDWDLQLNSLRGYETIAFRLPEFQESRELARLLNVKAAVHLADRDFDQALFTMRVAMRLARDVSEPKTIINNLVGIAIHAITMSNVENLIDQSGSPNLYWAIAQMPNPFIDLRPSIEFEITLPERYFPWLMDTQGAHRTPQQWNQLFQETIRDATVQLSLLPGLTESSSDEEFELAAQQFALRNYPQAVQILLDQGYTKEDVDDMPVAQALAIREQILYLQYTQRATANILLPYPESAPRADELQQSLSDIHRESIVGILLPSIQLAYKAQVRREAFRNALMVIEAIRMHLSANDGQLPSSLDEISVVPVPKFPFTGEPFEYSVEGDTAVLDLPIPRFHVQYEIQVDRSDRGN